MGLIKPNNYDHTEVYFSRIANALSHPARRRVIQLIQDGEFVTQTTLTRFLNLSQTAVNRHVSILKRAELIACDYAVHYDLLRLNEKTLEEFEEEVRLLRKPCV